MQKNYIIEEIHRIRQEYAKRFDNNLHAICRDAMHKQGCMNRRVIPANPKPAQSKHPKGEINQPGRLG